MVDKYIKEFLGARFPTIPDSELGKIQGAVLQIVNPLASAWSALQTDTEEAEDEELVIPVSQVLMLIQRIICLVGNASELISQIRRTNILKLCDSSWAKFGKDEFPNTGAALFGDDFHTSLVSRVEKDSSLAKAIAISKRSRETVRDGKGKGFSSYRKDSRERNSFFRWSSASKYGSRQSRNLFPYTKQRNIGQPFQEGRGPNPAPRSHFHEPHLPPRQPQQQFKRQ